jgi:hypothetical protein
VHGETRKQLGRLGVRAGPESTVYREYEQFITALWRVHSVGARENPAGYAGAIVGTENRDLAEAVHEMDSALDRFLAAAAEVAGVAQTRSA